MALIWNIYNFIQARAGFLKLQLECNCEVDGTEKYIICKTILENTSRSPINTIHAFLLILNRSIPFDERSISSICYELGNNKLDEFKQNDISRIQSILFTVLDNDDFAVKLLPYYYLAHERLGSYARMSTTHIQSIKHDGIYSIYFVIIGKEWYKGPWYKRYKGDPSEGRFVHDEILVKR